MRLSLFITILRALKFWFIPRPQPGLQCSGSWPHPTIRCNYHFCAVVGILHLIYVCSYFVSKNWHLRYTKAEVHFSRLRGLEKVAREMSNEQTAPGLAGACAPGSWPRNFDRWLPRLKNLIGSVCESEFRAGSVSAAFPVHTQLNFPWGSDSLGSSPNPASG